MKSDREILELVEKFNKGHIDKETLQKVLANELAEREYDKQQKKRDRHLKRQQLMTTGFYLVVILALLAGVAYLHLATAKHYVGLSTIRIFGEKIFGHTCDYRRCLGPADHKKNYHFFGKKSSVRYYCDQHIDQAPGSIITSTRYIAGFAFFVFTAGLGVGVIYTLFKVFVAAFEHYEFVDWFGALFFVNILLYLVPTAITFAL